MQGWEWNKVHNLNWYIELKKNYLQKHNTVISYHICLTVSCLLIFQSALYQSHTFLNYPTSTQPVWHIRHPQRGESQPFQTYLVFVFLLHERTAIWLFLRDLCWQRGSTFMGDGCHNNEILEYMLRNDLHANVQWGDFYERHGVGNGVKAYIWIRHLPDTFLMLVPLSGKYKPWAKISTCIWWTTRRELVAAFKPQRCHWNFKNKVCL